MLVFNGNTMVIVTSLVSFGNLVLHLEVQFVLRLFSGGSCTVITCRVSLIEDLVYQDIIIGARVCLVLAFFFLFYWWLKQSQQDPEQLCLVTFWDLHFFRTCSSTTVSLYAVMSLWWGIPRIYFILVFCRDGAGKHFLCTYLSYVLGSELFQLTILRVKEDLRLQILFFWRFWTIL